MAKKLKFPLSMEKLAEIHDQAAAIIEARYEKKMRKLTRDLRKSERCIAAIKKVITTFEGKK